jgi:Nuclease-related domain
MAGESAREVARRQRTKAERLERSAALWERGAAGEEATAAALAQLPTDTWTVFNDVKWPGRRYANVDHIVVGPPGVFVIDSKNWSGRVTVADDVLRQDGRSRQRDVAGAAEAGLAVAGLVQLLEPSLVHPVLCFVRDDELSGWARDVMVCSTSNVVAMLTSRPDVLAEHQVNQLGLDLDLGLRDAGLAAAVVPRPDPWSRPRTSIQQRAGARRTTGKARRGPSTAYLAKLVVAAAFVGVVVMRPDVVAGLADQVTGLFFDGATSDTSPPTPNEQSKKQADPKRGGS